MPLFCWHFCHFGIAFVLCIVVLGCSHTTSKHVDIDSRATNLTQSLESLSVQVLGQEADKVSNVLIETAIRLSDQYEMENPPLYHNMLVKMGLRDRGLCCHWAEDLHAALRKLNTSSLKFAWLVARQGSQLREHNSIVIYAEDNNWQQGIVFDPWRKAGVPFWTAVVEDDYPWKLHPLNGRWNVLRCK
ncbi:MAG: hypothetical protein AAF304_04995 [Pseudomonadota bacterium]